MKSGNFFGIHFFSILITISMNLFDHLLSRFERISSLLEEYVVRIIECNIFMLFGYENWSDLTSITPTLSYFEYQCLVPRKSCIIALISMNPSE